MGISVVPWWQLELEQCFWWHTLNTCYYISDCHVITEFCAHIALLIHSETHPDIYFKAINKSAHKRYQVKTRS